MDNNVKYLEYVDSDSLYYSKKEYKKEEEFKVEGIGEEWIISADDPVWKFYDLVNNELPEQGWKIHVSCDYKDAERTLKIVSEVLINNKIAFKHVKNKDVLFNMYSKNGNRISAGKFITIYTQENQFISLLNILYDKLKSFSKGPYILTDKQWKDSNIFYRYGGFKKIVSDKGELCIRDNDGKLVPDVREPRYYLPEFVKEPDELKIDTVGSTIVGKQNPLEFYEVEKAIRFTNSGGIYVGKSKQNGQKCVIKEAKSKIGLDGQYRTAAERLENEHNALSKLNGFEGIVQELDYFKVWEHTFLVEEFCEGEQFAHWIAQNYPFAPNDDKEKYIEKVKHIFVDLKKIIENMHKQNVAMCDLQSQNVLINKDTLEVKLIDFEIASEVNSTNPVGMATKGYMHPLNEIASEKDWYSLNRLFQYCFIPIGSVTDLDVRLNAVHCSWIRQNFGEETYNYFSKFQLECCNHLSHYKEIFENTYEINLRSDILSSDFEEIEKKLLNGLIGNCDTKSESLINGDIRQFENDCGMLNLLNGGFGAVYTLLKEGTLPKEIKNWIDMQLPVLRDKEFNDGFLTGRTGIACVMFEAGYVHEAESLLKVVLDNFDYDKEDLTFRSGLAGIGMAFCAFYSEGGNKQYLEQAEKLAQIIIKKINNNEELSTSDWDSVPLGLIDGYSGISLFFTLLYGITKDEKYKVNSIELLLKDIGNTYVSERDGSLQTVDSSKNRLLPYLAKGSIGIGIAIVALNKICGTNEFQKELDAICKVADYRCCFEPGLLDGAGGFLLCQCFTKENVTDKAMLKLRNFFIEKNKEILIPGKWFYKLSSDMYSGTSGIILALKSANEKNPLICFPLLHKFY